MTYEQLIAKVLNGKSVNARAKELGLKQASLDRYVKAINLPDCDVAIILADAAGVSIEEAVRAIAAKKAELRPERATSFLRTAIASILTCVISVNLFLTPQNAKAAPLLAYDDMQKAATLYYVKLSIEMNPDFQCVRGVQSPPT